MPYDTLVAGTSANDAYTARLLRALTDPDCTFYGADEDADADTFADAEAQPDLSQVSDEALGTLLVVAYAVDGPVTPARTAVASAVEDAIRTRQPAYTPDACRRMFEALAERREDRGWALLLGLNVLEHCTGQLPDLSVPARTLVGSWLEAGTIRGTYVLLTIAELAGEGTLRAAVERLADEVGPIVADEIAVVAGLPPAERAVLSAIEREHRFISPGTFSWQQAADSPAYVAFTRRALEAAADRTDAIRTGGIPYRADKAFTDREVTSLGQALRVALLRDEPWLHGLFERLLPGIALAPTAAKTLPSQALLYEVVRAAEEFPTPELVTAIRTVRRTVRHAGVPRQLDKMLKRVDAALAERTEVALRLPRMDFEPTSTGGGSTGSAGGILRRTAGEYQAVVTVAETATLTWEKEGRPLRGLPAPVRRDHPALVKELRELVKRVDAQLVTLVRALEGSFTVDAVHPFGGWRTDLIGHPLARTLVRRLIWEIEVAPGEWRAVLPEAVDHLPDVPDDASVRLWHPLRSDLDDVRAWRELLTERCIQQPFKQAFREIYLLTPAEEETRVHSNRFAAHLVHYRRMYALFRARGWRSSRLGPWDMGDGADAERILAAGAWRVRFAHYWVEWADIGDDELASTDQVRFDRRVEGVWREAPLADVPPLVFSEAMRDVDLFVGVTSVAADPEWADRTVEGHPGYWRRTAFGELTAGAEVRREVLERILPRLKIADRCSLDGRFLVVRGDLRTYRIHLGSANVLMQPNDAYLCIVPARGTGTGKGGGKVFLPFEDERLSLVLSKAFLLAADAKITDESIRVQIERGARWPE
ncbi:DUF4132 domain-containing protein [Streptomyces sp. NPDC089799]|uniref:DUF4132 domain-containing protein n=1 Tax=Streptomyces sp. NPDC089799 TaxID=3155066 RepID=UPI0034479535